MTSFEIGLLAALVVMIGLLLLSLRNRQPGGSADLAELRGQLAQISCVLASVCNAGIAKSGLPINTIR